MPFQISNPVSLPERLRGLPAFDPPPGGWERLSHRLQARRRHYRVAGTGLALAASLLAAVGLVNLRPQPGGPAPGFSERVRAEQQLAQLIDRSQRLEHRLSQVRPQVAVWDSSRASQAALLESRLRRVDAHLSYAEPAAAEALWRDRVRLMNALVALHEPQAPALQYASYQY